MARPTKNTPVEFLPEDYVPAPEEVIVGRGKKCQNHPGNKKLKAMVQDKLQEYATANDKTHKTYIISQIFQDLRDGGGGFVKKDNTNGGRWYRVKDPCARTNIAQCFRDSLHDSYRSSKFNKQRRRWCSIQQQKQQERMERQKQLYQQQQQQAKFLTAAANPGSAGDASELSSFGLHFMLKNQYQHQAAAAATTARCVPQAVHNASAAAAEHHTPGSMKQILCAALDVVRADGELGQASLEQVPLPPLVNKPNFGPAPVPLFHASTSNNDDFFDSLCSMAFIPTDEWESVNPFEPTPIAENALSA